MNTVDFFEKNRYVLIKEMIPKDIAKVASQYAHFDRVQNFKPEDETAQIPGSHSVYGDPLMETLLKFSRPHMEKWTGLELWPTYSYYRLYKPGDELKRHKDRPSCEISITCCLCYDYKDKDPYWYLINKSSHFIVTEDSVSMISDAVFTGKPVYMAKIKNKKKKIKSFVQNLEKRGVVRYFDGEIASWKYEKINESDRIANVIKKII